MREKKWIDCPLCGSKNSMKRKKSLHRRFVPRGYAPLEITGLDGQFCEFCGDGFWSREAERKITQAISEHMAKEDAERTVASELASVPEAAEVLQVSRQAVHKMMNEGRLRYVQTPSLRLPIRAYLQPARERMRRPAAKTAALKRSKRGAP